MSTVNRALIEQQLAQVIEPVTQRRLGDLGAIASIGVDQGKVSLVLVLGYPIGSLAESLAEAVNQTLNTLDGIDAVEIDIQFISPEPITANSQQTIPGVKHIIAVASGKGGVGKSTTAVNLALALANEGARVGLLDADIYGPSQPHMLGVGQRRPQVVGEQGKQQMLPIVAHDIQTISMGYLVTEETPMMWRGPMVSGALQQLLQQTRWDDVDYLIIDMPPGTGDIQITLAQKVPVTGAVIVTTPQDIALLDAKKAIEMFRKVNVPILGVVENMATHICSQCGHEEHIFGEGGGERIARDYQTELLGSLPLNLAIRADADSGKPSVAADAESTVSLAYRRIARKLAANLWCHQLDAQALPDIEITDD